LQYVRKLSLLITLYVLAIGVDLLLDALINSSKSLDRLEYAAMVLVGCIVATRGFVVGMCAGIGIACMTFVIQVGSEDIRCVSPNPSPNPCLHDLS
jgi:SulP family sulfate permease